MLKMYVTIASACNFEEKSLNKIKFVDEYHNRLEASEPP